MMEGDRRGKVRLVRTIVYEGPAEWVNMMYTDCKVTPFGADFSLRGDRKVFEGGTEWVDLDSEGNPPWEPRP